MGRFVHLIDSPVSMEGFRAKYYIPQGIAHRYYAPNQVLTHMNEGEVVRLVSCLPKSNKGMKDDFQIALGAWHDGLHCLVREGEPSGVP